MEKTSWSACPFFIVHEKTTVAWSTVLQSGFGNCACLCDLVIASDKATFMTPFTSLASSLRAVRLSLPSLMGTSQAPEVLLFGKKLTAEEALDRNLVAEVIPHAHFMKKVKKSLSLCQMPPESLRPQQEFGSRK
uniref:Uncharacterized protein n=1 Tax=Ditylenchus dipsaci TaxID=166011 RepID=A0A915CNM5_9BILA